jgi:hypothetical protein
LGPGFDALLGGGSGAGAPEFFEVVEESG